MLSTNTWASNRPTPATSSWTARSDFVFSRLSKSPHGHSHTKLIGLPRYNSHRLGNETRSCSNDPAGLDVCASRAMYTLFPSGTRSPTTYALFTFHAK